MATATELLTLVDAAISDLLTGKIAEYQIGTVRYRYQDLDRLVALRRELKAMLRTAGDRIRLAHLGGV